LTIREIDKKTDYGKVNPFQSKATKFIVQVQQVPQTKMTRKIKATFFMSQGNESYAVNETSFICTVHIKLNTKVYADRLPDNFWS
jgi:hypothetical protein